MGIFSFLSRDRDLEAVAPAPATAQEEGKRMGRFPDLRKEMPLELLGEDGQVAIRGRITECSRQEIVLRRHPGGLSFHIYEPGTNVVVQGRDSRMERFYLRAVVAESSRIRIRLTDLEQEEREDLRSTFRLEVNAPISIYSYGDERMLRPEACTLVDISAGGCCISSEYLHGEDEVLRLKIKLEHYATMDLVGEVIRVTQHGPNDIRCGILFAQLTKDEHESLTRMLFNLQVGNRR